ncbi:MAG TPA: mechanosensitive ion channel domain-containing protein [Thermoanaerobaculia bacterium]|nr:mechanosensitive ion channel domain-containing protein [Thermoanaerobaculia bacterium]
MAVENPDLVAAVRDSLADLEAWLRLHQVKLLGAVALLALGWLLGLFLRAVVSRLIRALGRMVPERLLRHGLPRPGKRELSDIVGLIVFWAVVLFFAAAAANVLGLPLLGSSLAGIGAYVPRLVGAALIMLAGLVIGNLARDAAAAAAAAAGSPFAAAIGQIVRAAILLAAGLIAVAELGIDITLLTALLSVTLLAMLGAFSLAFGLGARDAVSNIIGAHYVRQTFEIGRQLRIGDVEGTIAAITATSVILQSAGGQVVIPAKLFNETIAVMVTPGGAR